MVNYGRALRINPMTLSNLYCDFSVALSNSQLLTDNVRTTAAYICELRIFCSNLLRTDRNKILNLVTVTLSGCREIVSINLTRYLAQV